MLLVLCDPSDRLLHLLQERLVQSVIESYRLYQTLHRLEPGALKVRRSSKLRPTHLASGYESSLLEV